MNVAWDNYSREILLCFIYDKKQYMTKYSKYDFWVKSCSPTCRLYVCFGFVLKCIFLHASHTHKMNFNLTNVITFLWFPLMCPALLLAVVLSSSVPVCGPGVCTRLAQFDTGAVRHGLLDVPTPWGTNLITSFFNLPLILFGLLG